MNTATLEGAPDRTAHARGDRLQLGPPGLAFVEPRARSLYALPPWGILVIRCEEKTVIADTTADVEPDIPLNGPLLGKASQKR